VSEVRETSVKHVVAFQTDIGRVHHINQDAGGAWTVVRSDGIPASFAVVADGVSSGLHSEDASRMVVDLLRERLESPLADPATSAHDLLDHMVAAARSANHEVARRPHSSVQTAASTTLAASACVGQDVSGVWCGDSRVYRAGSKLARLTRDHSWAEGVVSNGLMTRDEAARDPRAHMITRWLGPPDQLDPGLETFTAHLEPGESILCCSDGLYAHFSPALEENSDVSRMIETEGLDSALKSLVQTACREGGLDNITGAAIQITRGAS
jgi:serine/threonine protein phosphatase PrpC